MSPVELPRCGRLWSRTVIGEREDAPEDFVEFVPYAVGIFELDVPGAMNPVRVTGRLTDIPRDIDTGKIDRSYLEIGAPFETVTRVMRRNGDKGIIEYGPLWRPALAAELSRMGADSV